MRATTSVRAANRLLPIRQIGLGAHPSNGVTFPDEGGVWDFVKGGLPPVGAARGEGADVVEGGHSVPI